jgi:hypothetical protein
MISQEITGLKKMKIIPEKARLLEKLKTGPFNVPDFIYVPPEDFEKEQFTALKGFLEKHRESFKVIARSAHPAEEFYKGGTFTSLETYADTGGIVFARKKMIRALGSTCRLSILRQQRFSDSPDVVPGQMGVIVMPFIEGTSVMAKKIRGHWEFGFCRNRAGRVQNEPYITSTPHNRHLIEISAKIQKILGFRCEIEYIISNDNQIFVVQAKDISGIELLEEKETERAVKLDGIRRVRVQRSYRERPIYMLDMQDVYMQIIGCCEEMVLGVDSSSREICDILQTIQSFERELVEFALKHQRFGVIGICMKPPEFLYQVANHYLDDMPELQQQLSGVLHQNLYATDSFLAEADTLITKDRVHLSLCGHDAYGIDTVRNPVWSVYWHNERDKEVVDTFKTLGFKTGDTVCIDIEADDKPLVYRL